MMSNLTVTKKCMLDPVHSLVCDFTYSVSSTSSQTVFTLSNVHVLRGSIDSGSFVTGVVRWSLTVNGTRIWYDGDDINNTGNLPVTATFNRAMTSQTINVVAHLEETSSGQTTEANTKTTFTVPVLDKTITSVSIGNAKAIRVANASSTVEADEGTYAYITIPYTVLGVASADVVMDISVTPSTASVTKIIYQAQKTEGSTLSGTFTARASNCSVDSQYDFSITITASNTSTGATQNPVVVTRTIVLASAYFVMDVKAGGGGVHFGGAAVDDGFWVSMEAHFKSQLSQYGNVNGRINAETLSAYAKIGGFIRYDSNNEPVFYSEQFRTTDNMLYSSFMLRRYSEDGSSYKNHGFYLDIKNDNSLAVRFPSTESRDAWANGLNVVKKAGDMMTGTLYIKSSNVEAGVAPTANTWANSQLILRDANDVELGRVGVYFGTSGAHYLSIRTARYMVTNWVYNEVGLRIDDSGNRSIYLSDAAIWRNALGVNNEVTVKTASSVSVASGTAWSDGTTITNSGSLAAGTYVIRGYVSFASNATGRRFTAIMTSNTGTSVYNNMVDSRTAINGAATHCNIIGVVTLTAATTLYLRVTQNSGSALTCAGRMEILKIH